MARRVNAIELSKLYHEKLMGAFGGWYRFDADETGDDKPRVPTLLVFDDGTVEFYHDGFNETGYMIGGYYCLPKTAEPV